MPISPYVNFVPGSIGSFPQAGIRPKQTKYAIFSSSGVWVCPPNVFSVNFTMCGGGGGGGAGDGGANPGGGGAGAMSIIDCPITVIPGTTYTITVGAGGTGGNPTNTNNATSGGVSSIVGGLISLFVSGGRGGIVGPASAVAAATVPSLLGATTTLLSNLQAVAGGQGSLPNNNGGNSVFSIGGLSNGSTIGGAGGASFLGSGGNGGSASVGATPTGYGGGGGGGSATNIGGNGAPGVCQLVWLEGI